MRTVTLGDKYACEFGRIYLSGSQAIVRILLDQRRRDARAGLRTAGFISGYRGSPLGGVDHALWQAKRDLAANDIVFTPGVNEELAATAVYGTQHLEAFGAAKVESVFAAWYGKGPGVDRAGDALKHGNLAGAARNGGVLVFAGDDHQAKSSTTAHQSEQALAAAFIPVLYPASVGEYLRFGAMGYALSRYSGLWVGFKCVNETADASGVALIPDDVAWREPEGFLLPPEGLHHIQGETQLGAERRTVEFRLPAAQAFAAANGFDEVALAGTPKRLGLVTAGKAYLDVWEALRLLGLTPAKAQAAGISILKLGLVWPASGAILRSFAEDHAEVLVVEEKRALIEPQLKEALYHAAADRRPRVSGKATPEGAPLLAASGELTPLTIARAIAGRLAALGASGVVTADALVSLQAAEAASAVGAISTHTRGAFFCSGCPHNSSTVLPDGAVGLAGIGCHVMAAFMPHRKHVWPVQMGGEGVNWVGAAPFSATEHVFQNLGDGTYFHSGLLAIRAAVAARVNITYKLLFNDAVAMTGGQPVEGQLDTVRIARELLEEGVARVVIVADDPGRYEPVRGRLQDVAVRPRADMLDVQTELAAITGATVLIYDQVCAAEKRRKRKRAAPAAGPTRVFINPDVCEGCGDCGRASNCVSVQPLETDLGRKRTIDQSSCSTDLSCVNGFCPSFVTLDGAKPKARVAEAQRLRIPPLPEPAPVAGAAAAILVTGIGGTGVITIGALLGMAAHLEGKHSSVLDMTGLSQKNGAVYSHVRIAPAGAAPEAARIPPQSADLLLACDMLAAAAPDAVATLRPGRTAGVVNARLTPTAAFTFTPDIDFDDARMARSLRQRLATERSLFLDASTAAKRLLGDTILSNMLLLGVASQRGLLPVGRAAIEEAIRLNGVAVEANLLAFGIGRWAAVDPGAVQALVDELGAEGKVPPDSLDELIARRARLLEDYQDARYARRFLTFVEEVRARESAVSPGSEALTAAVAKGLSKLMAYKDEYEVARLYVAPAFRRRLEAEFEGRPRLTFHMAPPLISRPGSDGRPRKIRLGAWLWPLLHVLAAARRLRGGPLDLFGWTAERRLERSLVLEYMAEIRAELSGLDRGGLPRTIALASLPDQIRGFGHVKLEHLAAARRQAEDLKAKAPVAA